ncbi:MAG: hypothetical protein KGS72_25955 [Cyanobacteria bacterium REEB67]|nr:hypothetical protein [Cyanobacteria bacterium REEB67]
MKAKHVPTGRKSKASIRDFYLPSALTVSSDVIQEQAGSTTIVRLIDQISSYRFPVAPPFWIIAELCAQPGVTPARVTEAEVYLKLVMLTPKDALIEFGEFRQTPPDVPDWFMTRFLVNASGGIAFQNLGYNRIQLLGKVGSGNYELLLERLLPVKKMSREEFVQRFGFEPPAEPNEVYDPRKKQEAIKKTTKKK